MPRSNESESREMKAHSYEAIVASTWREARGIPKGFAPRIKPGKRGDAEGYANASVWRIAESSGELSDVDVGFLIAIESLAQKVAYLEHRIMIVENK